MLSIIAALTAILQIAAKCRRVDGCATYVRRYVDLYSSHSFFILAGNIMNQGGIAKRLLTLLWHSSASYQCPAHRVGANALFGAISGSASAAAAASVWFAR